MNFPRTKLARANECAAVGGRECHPNRCCPICAAAAYNRHINARPWQDEPGTDRYFAAVLREAARLRLRPEPPAPKPPRPRRVPVTRRPPGETAIPRCEGCGAAFCPGAPVRAAAGYPAVWCAVCAGDKMECAGVWETREVRALLDTVYTPQLKIAVRAAERGI